MRILVVEDERSLSDAICEGLRDNFFAVDQAFDGLEALSKVEVELFYDLIILDIMLPKLDGIAMLKELRKRGHKMAVLMLTARNSVDDKLESFTGGADDYLTKPFDFRELLARAAEARQGDENLCHCRRRSPDRYIDKHGLEGWRGNRADKEGIPDTGLSGAQQGEDCPEGGTGKPSVGRARQLVVRYAQDACQESAKEDRQWKQ
jgi:DNA-binding response OmpR family regulator